MFTFMRNAMKSIAFSDRKSSATDALGKAAVLIDEEADIQRSPADPVARADANPLRILLRLEDAHTRDQLVDQLFGGNTTAQLVAHSLLDGKRPAEICADLGIDSTAFASARRFIRRRVERFRKED